MKLLLLSTPVGPLGSGLGGGVELTLLNLAKALSARGHRVAIAAPVGSTLPGNPVPIIEIAGELQPTAHTQGQDAPIALPPDAVLAHLWDYARQVQGDYDLLVNFAYDWLPFYLTAFFQRPVLHFVTMGSLSKAMDRAIAQVAKRFPQRLGAYTQSQVDTFSVRTGWQLLGSAVDLIQYRFCAQPQDYLVWLGRISPEKGLEDAVAAAQRSCLPLKILGQLEDPQYWQHIQQRFPTAPVEYLGFYDTAAMQAVLRSGRALVMTPRWVEAFGNVAIEALACGVPVVAYRRGGPAEIVKDGETGWLVEPDSVEGLVAALGKIDTLDRSACRQQAEAEYALTALGDRFEVWFRQFC